MISQVVAPGWVAGSQQDMFSWPFNLSVRGVIRHIQSVMGVRHSDAGGGWKIKLTHIGKSLFGDGFTMR